MTDANPSYRVLARKYRPTDFDQLIGQEAMVRTLRNALEAGRLAHAFILTGVRGIGKTTTARIIARALNCVGADGHGEPTMRPCGVCEHCRAIAEDRDVDVLEIDAASHTGVNRMREITDSVHYAPVSARFKVYIIDEVHMLSPPAFAALLKTLEEPPPHVTFILATTEIRKVPVTVLSRCQRFDLRRLSVKRLAGHLSAIAAKEDAKIDPAAVALIARAAEGSVRDGLSLLDQAIAYGDAGGEAEIRRMIGLADRTRILDLLDSVLSGDIAQALAILGEQYETGADPIVILQDLLELTHWLTRLKVVAEVGDDMGVAESERARGRVMVDKLSMAALARAWQMLLKGLAETQTAPHPLAAAEMVLIRLCHVADLPTPADLVTRLADGGAPPAATPSSPAPDASPPTNTPPAAAAAPVTTKAQPRSFVAVAELAAEHGEMRLYASLKNDVRPVSFAPGQIEIHPEPTAPQNLPRQLRECLERWTGQPWEVVVSDAAGAPTLTRQDEIVIEERRAGAAQHPSVQAVMAAFPGAEIVDVHDIAPVRPDADHDAGHGTALDNREELA